MWWKLSKTWLGSVRSVLSWIVFKSGLQAISRNSINSRRSNPLSSPAEPTNAPFVAFSVCEVLLKGNIFARIPATLGWAFRDERPPRMNAIFFPFFFFWVVKDTAVGCPPSPQVFLHVRPADVLYTHTTWVCVKPTGPGSSRRLRQTTPTLTARCLMVTLLSAWGRKNSLPTSRSPSGDVARWSP